jgi:hypothetical protein
MAVFKTGDKVSFTGSAVIEGLFGMVGVVVKIHRSGGHYVYNIRLASRVNLPPSLIGGMRLVGSILTSVPSDWIELY